MHTSIFRPCELDLSCPTLQSPGTISHGCQIAPLDLLNAKQMFLINRLFGLCENAWLPWQPVMRFLLNISKDTWEVKYGSIELPAYFTF